MNSHDSQHDPAKGLYTAKHEKFQSLKNVYTVQSRILKLKVDEDRMLKKIENERKKAEQIQKVRESYDQMIREIREASNEREKQR